MSVPRFLLRALSGPTGHQQRPTEARRRSGSRFYDGTAFSLGNTLSPVQTLQTFLYPLDNTPAMDFVIPAAGGGGDERRCPARSQAAARSRPLGQVQPQRSRRDAAEGQRLATATRPRTSTRRRSRLRRAPIRRTARIAEPARTAETTSRSYSTSSTAARRRLNDTFSLTMTPGGSRSGNLTKGNIQIHKK